MLDLLNVVVKWLVFLYILDIRGSNFDSKMAVLTEVFRGFLQSLPEIARLVTAIGLQLLPCKSSSYYSLISFDLTLYNLNNFQSLCVCRKLYQHLKFVDFVNVLIMANK